MEYKILAVGDVVGDPGLNYLAKHLRKIKRELGADFCIVNGENAASIGLSPRHAESIFDAGADVITLGNHTWGRRDICAYLDDNRQILRPANFAPNLPGRGWGIFPCGRDEIAVVNLIGRCNMNFNPDNPFTKIETVLKEVGDVPVFIDFHAEATSEKQAMAFMLDGKVSAVFGTHTHVPTADARVLPKGTGFVCDLGMTGPLNGVIGVKPEQSIAMFRGELTSRFESAPGPCCLNAARFTLDYGTKHCKKVERIDIYD